MLKIDGNNKITLTRGDTLTLTLELTGTDGNPYEPEEGDSLRFAISTGYLGGPVYELKYETAIPMDTLTGKKAARAAKLGNGLRHAADDKKRLIMLKEFGMSDVSAGVRIK